jgi:hypothetical protein
MPLAFLTQKVLLSEPANAGSSQARSAEFQNAISSELNAFCA